MKTCRPLAVACCALAAILAGQAQAAVKAPPLARAGEVTITKEEFTAYARREGITNLAVVTLEQRRALATKLVVRKSLARDAEKKGYAREPAAEKAFFQWKVSHYPEAYLVAEVDKKVTVTDAELRALVDPQEEFLLSAMLFTLEDAGLQKAREIGVLLAAGGNFVELAKERSEGLSASKGGDMGWQTFPSSSVGEEEAKVIRRTKVGGYTEPLETQVGWAIYWVRDHHSADDIFKRERAAARETLLAEKTRVARAAELQRIRDKAVISYPADAPGAAKGAPLAVVDGFKIQPDSLGGESEKHGVSPTGTLKSQMEKFITAFLLMREAERVGLDSDPDLRVQEQLERVEVLAQIAIRKEAESRVTVTDAALREEYRRAFVPEVYELQMVVGNDRAKIEDAHRRIIGGASFDAVAGEDNDTWLGKNNGRLGLAPIVDYSPEVQAAIVALPDGGVSAVLPHGDGRWVVVKRLASKRVEVPTFEQAAPSIRSKLTIKQRADQVKVFVEQYRKKLNVVVDDALLRKL